MALDSRDAAPERKTPGLLRGFAAGTDIVDTLRIPDGGWWSAGLQPANWPPVYCFAGGPKSRGGRSICGTSILIVLGSIVDNAPL